MDLRLKKEEKTDGFYDVCKWKSMIAEAMEEQKKHPKIPVKYGELANAIERYEWRYDQEGTCVGAKITSLCGKSSITTDTESGTIKSGKNGHVLSIDKKTATYLEDVCYDNEEKNALD